MSAPRLQVVVAHPDDETFGCGSLLLHARASGASTSVVCATRGEAGGDDPGLGAVREGELRAAGALLGVDDIELLGFADSGMSGPVDPRSLVGASYDDVLDAVRRSMVRWRPDVVVTLDATDGHRDHARIRDAAVEVAAELEVPRVYLSCLPRSLMRRWADHMRRERPEMEHLDVDAAELGMPDEDITTVVDARGHLALREQAMALHASQQSPFDGLPDELRRAFLEDVHARRVAPPWTGGAPESDFLLR